jgi:hypothetical protein
MSLYISNLSSFISGLEKAKKVPEEIIRKKMIRVLSHIHQKVTIRTPVHTGKSLRNWVWSVDKPATTSNLPALGNGEPGQTSKMKLGTEPRRAVNQAAVDASFAALDLSQPLRAFWLSNNSSEILDLEYGKLPTPGRSRNPAGMAAVTFQEALALFGK